jgi:hypothetical protein
MRMQGEGVTKEALTEYIARRRHRLEGPVTFGGQGSQEDVEMQD